MKSLLQCNDFYRGKMIAFNWIPNASDISFLKNLISLISDGGIWAIPNARAGIQFNKKEKSAKLIYGEKGK
jgi:hypothetical protein